MDENVVSLKNLIFGGTGSRRKGFLLLLLLAARDVFLTMAIATVAKL